MRRNIRRCRCRKRRRFCCPSSLLRLVLSLEKSKLCLGIEANESLFSSLLLVPLCSDRSTGRDRQGNLSFTTVSMFLCNHARRLLYVKTACSANDLYRNGVSVWAGDETLHGPYFVKLCRIRVKEHNCKTTVDTIEAQRL